MRRTIVLNFIIKFGAILLSYITLPITLNYLGSESYGVWTTIFTTLTWIQLLDFGIGNSLKTSMTAEVTRNNVGVVRAYIGGAYLFSFLIVIVTFVAVFFTLGFIDVNALFGVKHELSEPLKPVILATVIFILINLVLNLVGSFLLSVQESVLAGLIELFVQVLIFVLIFTAARANRLTLMCLAVITGGTRTVVLVAFTVIFFRKRPQFLPSPRDLSLSGVSHLLTQGIKFLVIQLCCIVLYSKDSFVIIRNFGPDVVTEYSLVYKLMGMFITGYAVLSIPFWTRYAQEYTKQNFAWIDRTVNRLYVLLAAICVALIVMCLGMNLFLRIWTGNVYHVAYSFSSLIAVFVAFRILIDIDSVLINSIGKINFQVIVYVVVSALNIVFLQLALKYFHRAETVLAITSLTAITISALMHVFSKKVRSLISKGSGMGGTEIAEQSISC